MLFNLLQEAVGKEHGLEVWEELLAQVASERFGITADAFIIWFGVESIALLARK